MKKGRIVQCKLVFSVEVLNDQDKVVAIEGVETVRHEAQFEETLEQIASGIDISSLQQGGGGGPS